ncbi:MAG: carbohydrate kinase family protein [Gammaproteobacteria bacterium]|jgi:sugar/nucleoside kinase (ribokinase family)
MPGIACAGHWVVDHIKFIDHWPKKSELCNIKAELLSNGGAPFNIIINLANLNINIPTYGIGCIGDDFGGRYIKKLCKFKKINIKFLQTIKKGMTAYTDVMTLQRGGIRTMFHFRGVNRIFAHHHIPIKKLQANETKLFYFGHLLLMDAMESPDARFVIAAAKVLHDVQQAGMETVVDIATESANRYQKIVIPALPYIDHFVINELEAQKTSGQLIRDLQNNLNKQAIKKAAQFLFERGVKKNVIIHMPEGSYWLIKGKQHGTWYPSLNIPPHGFVAACGAGDAFCTGILVGLHEQWPHKKTQKLATACAAAAIGSPHNSDGIKPLDKTLKLADEFGLKNKIQVF